MDKIRHRLFIYRGGRCRKRESGLKRIDFHTHIYPDKIALKASRSVGEFYHMSMCYDGSVSMLLRLGERYGIDRFVVHPVATEAAQVRPVNDYTALMVRTYPDRFTGFATILPGFEDAAGEIDRAVSLGLRGIKLHPDFQKFAIDDERAFSIYEAAEGRLPILFHTGDFRYEYSNPARLARVLDRFPKLLAIGAHFGGWSEWDEAARVLAGRGVYVDTSSSLYAVPPEHARELIGCFGADHVLFGTDYPMWDPGEELARVAQIGLSPEETEMIMHGNAERLLGIPNGIKE